METKPFYLSKTLWVNALAIAGMILQSKMGFAISPESQIAILGVINLILRAVTKAPVDWL